MSLTTLFPTLLTYTPSLWSTYSPIIQELTTLITACKTDPILEAHIGQTYFTTYTATTPIQLSIFLFIINAHPPLAAYVTRISLDENFDGVDGSGVFDMLLCIRDINSIDEEEEKNEEEMGSELLRWLADEFWLMSMGDVYGVPDRVFYTVVSELWKVAGNVKRVEMSGEWQKGFKDADVWLELEGEDLVVGGEKESEYDELFGEEENEEMEMDGGE